MKNKLIILSVALAVLSAIYYIIQKLNKESV